LIGVYINGYAFGDIDQLVPIIERLQREENSRGVQAESGMEDEKQGVD
jgi:hypothetical protein